MNETALLLGNKILREFWKSSSPHAATLGLVTAAASYADK